MEEFQLNTVQHDFAIPTSNSTVSGAFHWDKDVMEIRANKDLAVEGECDSLEDSMLCDPSSRLIPTGFMRSNCTDEIVMFVNAGGEALREADSNMDFMEDTFFQGGDIIGTEERIIEGGDFPFIYQSARYGNFYYRFDKLTAGDYFVDLHFVEIINTNGPKGMRVFHVFIQEEKVLSNLDIFSIVGGNKPMQLVDFRVSVKDDGTILIRFEGVHGCPMVSGICIRRASDFPATQDMCEYFKCNNCAAQIELPPAQKKLMQMKSSTAKFEKKIHELSTQCQQKTDECYQAWMSLTAANEQLEKVRMELDNRLFQTYSMDQTLEKQAETLRDISTRYEHDKKFWIATINGLEGKIKKMKQEHSVLSREAHDCAESIPNLNKMVSAVQGLVAQCEDLKVKYSEEQAMRKKLFNQVQETKGNIRVFCRCRPLNKVELSAGYATVVDFDAANDGILGILPSGSNRKVFKFDRVYTPKDDQVDVFADAAPLVISVLDGYNVCIFAYGQTGTGKTFTMEGTEQNRGVNYRTLEKLFEAAKERRETVSYNISVSVLEVYNEQIRDLLATSSTSKKLEIKQASDGFHTVSGILEAKVDNIKEVWNVLQAGSSARAIGSNNINEHSSRSHCMLCIMVRAKNLMNGECTKSKLWLVDLAGSERLAKTDVQGERLKEAQNINRSLSALGDVISALANKSSHIPYRNSKLTHLLQDSLGGDSKTLMFVQVSPSEHDLGETLSSLNFATRVRGIELGPAKKQIDTSENQKLKTTIEKVRQESKSKDETLRRLEDNLQALESKARSKDQIYKSQQEKIKELEGQLNLRATLQSESENQLCQLQERLKGRDEVCTSLQLKVKEMENKLREQNQEQSESSIFRQKVKDLENKLKEQVQLSDSHSFALEQKVKELETKLEEQERNSESSILQQKIKELEDKLREQEKQQSKCIPTQDLTEKSKCTPYRSSYMRDESLSESESHVLRTSNSMNSQAIPGSNLLNKESDYNVRRKRESRGGETENKATEVSSWVDKKIRKSEPPPKPMGRTTTRGTKPPSMAADQRRINRDQVQGVKERDIKKRIWSR